MMKKKMFDAAVVGAGASGLMAAITAARNGASTVLLEHMELPGKKILATGNGKCNYTNRLLHETDYYCSEPAFLEQIWEQFCVSDTIRFFDGLGIRPLEKNGTCIYPESEQAASVREALLMELERLKVPLQTGIGIRSIQKKAGCFFIETKCGSLSAKSCVLATGGCAAKKTGSDGSGFIYAKKLGHTLIPPLPALVALKAEEGSCQLPAGVRIRCKAALLTKKAAAEPWSMQAAETGELQITDYGLSGIVIFQISHRASLALSQKQLVRVLLDFKPDEPEEALLTYLKKRFLHPCSREKNAAQCLSGFLPEKMISPLLKQSGINKTQNVCTCGDAKLRKLCGVLKGFEVDINGTKGFEAAQVTMGGIPLAEISGASMESRIVPGLFFAGEMVDVDGKCGGYNLQWAWSSGYVAGRWAAHSTRISGEQEP